MAKTDCIFHLIFLTSLIYEFIIGHNLGDRKYIFDGLTYGIAHEPFEKTVVSVHRVPHLLCWRALEVQGVRLRTRRLASVAPCKRLQNGEGMQQNSTLTL